MPTNDREIEIIDARTGFGRTLSFGVSMDEMSAAMMALGGRHEDARIMRERNRYVRGEIELDEFESQLELILGLRAPNASDVDSAGRPMLLAGAMSSNDLRAVGNTLETSATDRHVDTR